jgi:hypothetical protein
MEKIEKYSINKTEMKEICGGVMGGVETYNTSYDSTSPDSEDYPNCTDTRTILEKDNGEVIEDCTDYNCPDGIMQSYNVKSTAIKSTLFSSYTSPTRIFTIF